MVAPAAPDSIAEVAPTRFRVALEFAINGELRYLSHHDEIRMLVRAVVRAGWPLAYSRGFNPLPRVRLPLPRNVGIASECEWGLVDLQEAREPAELSERLAAVLPRDCTLQRVIAPAPRETPQPRRVVYVLRLDAETMDAMGERANQLMARDSLRIQRDYGPDKVARSIDIRPYIETLTLDGDELRIVLCFDAQRTARPGEVLTELGLAPADHQNRLRRAEIHWNMELCGPEWRPGAVERD
jgi:radical SAM-linked protein